MKTKIISAIQLITFLSGMLAACEFIQAGQWKAALWAVIAIAWCATGYFAISAVEYLRIIIDTISEEQKRQAQLLADLAAQLVDQQAGDGVGAHIEPPTNLSLTAFVIL